MYLRVLSQLGRSHKSLSAQFAAKVLLSLVLSHMMYQTGPLNESLSALRAQIRPFSCVYSLVHPEVLPLGEALPADVAVGDLLTLVRSEMLSQNSLAGQLCTTGVAETLLRWLLEQLGVRSLQVSLETLLVGKASRTVLALDQRSVCAFLRVKVSHMGQKVLLVVEDLVAYGTRMGGSGSSLVKGLVLEVLGPLHETAAADVATVRVVPGVTS